MHIFFYVCMYACMHVYILLDINFTLIQSAEEALSDDEGEHIEEDES